MLVAVDELERARLSRMPPKPMIPIQVLGQVESAAIDSYRTRAGCGKCQGAKNAPECFQPAADRWIRGAWRAAWSLIALAALASLFQTHPATPF